MKHLGAVLILLAVIVPSLTFRLSVCPAPWFDEGLRTNLARTVLERGVYGTATVDGIHPFDPATSTGPADIGPLVASFRLFGIGPLQARAPYVLYGITGVLFLYAIAVWLWGRPAALIVLLGALATPRVQHLNLLAMARQVMGETPAMALGVASLWFLFRSWTGDRRWAAAVAGAAAALAFYSKGQVVFGLVPAIAAAELARSRRAGWQVDRLVALIAGAGVVGGAWWLVQFASTTPELRRQHAELIGDQVSTQFFVLGPRLFIGGTWLLFAVLCLAFALGVVFVWRRWRPLSVASARQCAMIGLLAGVGFTAAWYITLSVGWARYANFGVALSGLFFGRAACEVLLRLRRFARRRRIGLASWAYPAAVASLSIVALYANLRFLRACAGEDYAGEMAERIRQVVPREAVIESTDWEIDALSGHWNFHHPGQRETTILIRQRTAGLPLDLGYDMLAADPDYLLRGVFSGYFEIYPEDIVRRHFRLLDTVGPYRFYERVRDGEAQPPPAG